VGAAGKAGAQKAQQAFKQTRQIQRQIQQQAVPYGHEGGMF
jgi:hypothetical protein